MKKIILSIFIIILIVLAFLAGAYFSSDINLVLNRFNKNIQNFQKTDVGSLIKQVGSEILNPAPLKVNSPFKDVVLVDEKIFLETNIQRNINGGLVPLSRNKFLDKAALAKANDMFKNQYFEHNSPDGVTPADLVKANGYSYIVTGENLILGNFASEKELVQAWMNSPGHRANILNKRYTEIGVALVKGTFKSEVAWIGVQEFGLPLSACNEPEVNLKNKIDKSKIDLDNLSTQIDQKREEVNAALSDYEKYNALVAVYNQMVSQYQAQAAELKNLIATYNAEVSTFNQCVAGSNL